MVIDDKSIAINALIDAVTAIERTLGITPYGVYADVRVRLDILEARINNPNVPAPNVTNPFYIDGYGGVSISVGDGYPTENRVNGSLYLRRDGYTEDGLYARRSGNWELIPTDSWIAAGDLSGGYTNQTVIGIQGNPISSNTPSDGYSLSFRSGSWYPTRQPIVFDVLPESQNITANRPLNQSTINSSKIGIVNLGNDDLSTPISVNGNYATSLGGNRNLVLADYSTICGGLNNSVLGSYSSILGGANNKVSGNHASIAGGFDGYVDGYCSNVLGGVTNSIRADYSSILNGINNSINSNFVFINGSGNEVATNSSFSQATGFSAKCRVNGQVSHAVNSLTKGYEQYSKIILSGSETNGGQFNLTVPLTSSNISMEDGKSYDMHLRILVVNTSGTPTCARFTYNILAHQESGTLTIDIINDYLTDDNGTGWSVTLGASGSELIVQIDSYGSDDRRAMATIEWRELSRL